jgi:DNA polymerase-1
VRDLNALQSWIDAAHARGVVAVDTETTSLNEMTAELVGLSLSVEPGRACYIPVGHVTGGGDDLFAEGATLVEGQIGLEDALPR